MFSSSLFIFLSDLNNYFVTHLEPIKDIIWPVHNSGSIYPTYLCIKRNPLLPIPHRTRFESIGFLLDYLKLFRSVRIQSRIFGSISSCCLIQLLADFLFSTGRFKPILNPIMKIFSFVEKEVLTPTGVQEPFKHGDIFLVIFTEGLFLVNKSGRNISPVRCLEYPSTNRYFKMTSIFIEQFKDVSVTMDIGFIFIPGLEPFIEPRTFPCKFDNLFKVISRPLYHVIRLLFVLSLIFPTIFKPSLIFGTTKVSIKCSLMFSTKFVEMADHKANRYFTTSCFPITANLSVIFIVCYSFLITIHFVIIIYLLLQFHGFFFEGVKEGKE